MITQAELRRARRLQDAMEQAISEIMSRISAGAYVEPGELAPLEGRIVASDFKRGIEGFELLARLVDEEDRKFFAGDRRASAKLRKARARIFLLEVRSLRAEVAQAFRARSHRSVESGKWGAYLKLLPETALAYFSLFTLSLHGRLFYLNLPVRAGLARNARNVHRYLSVESLAPDLPG